MPKIPLAIVFMLFLVACGQSAREAEVPPIETQDQTRTTQTESESTLTRTSTPSPTASEEPTRSPSLTPSPSPEPVYASVSAPTNCRIGPGVRYQRTGALLPEATAEVVARSSTPNFWYIKNPDREGELCYLWGEYASLEGEIELLPVITPPPSPTPSPAFNMSLDGFFTCGSDEYVVLKIHNPTQITYMTAQKHLIDLDTSKDLYGPELDRHPFATGSRDCPPGHENEIYPDHVAYIYMPVRGDVRGHTARAIIMVCTEDYLGGDCWVQAGDFKLP